MVHFRSTIELFNDWKPSENRIGNFNENIIHTIDMNIFDTASDKII